MSRIARPFLLIVGLLASAAHAAPDHPILFVTQFPIADDFATIGSTFGNHRATMQAAGRGGDLYIRYPNGTLCNVTRDDGYGEPGTFQGANAIAVRDPYVHWDGTKALFSMVIGAPSQQFEVIEVYWQLYEVTGLGVCATTSITKMTDQPAHYNNITPIYSPDGAILFTSDRPRNGARHLYPQHDEYESTATNTGLWRLDPASGRLNLLNHTPSGAFTPTIDRYGRILFTRWDHLQRDQQADASGNPHGTFDWANEGADAPKLPGQEVFPEPRIADPDTNVNGLRINHFFPWQINPDGTDEETLNHVGRHELHDYFNQSFDDDPNLIEMIAAVSGRTNPNAILNAFQVKEDPTTPGRYWAVDAPEFQTHASGLVVAFDAPPTLPADQIVIDYATHPDTGTVVADGDTPPVTHTGHYREPLPLSNGEVLVVHTAETRGANNDGTRANPQPRYDFRIKQLVQAGPYRQAGAPLLAGAGIARTLQYFDPDVQVSYSGPLWELQPVEIRSRPAPPIRTVPLDTPEASIFADEGVDPEALRGYLRNHGLALITSRDVTTREVLDRQQPFNLRVPGGVQTTGAGGVVYEVAHLQLFQGDQVRGIGGTDDPQDGRRVLARVLHDPAVINPPTNGPQGSVAIAADGSIAAFVPTRRALSWHLTDAQGLPVLRERYWLTFQPGEIRVCASCHGLNSVDQAGATAPTNPPEALRSLLQFWKDELMDSRFGDGFESGDTNAWTTVVAP